MRLAVEHGDTVCRAHAPSFFQNEDGIDFRFNQRVAELRNHPRKVHDGVNQRIHVSLGASAEAIEQRPGFETARHSERLFTRQATFGRQHAKGGVLKQFGGDAAHPQENRCAERIAVHAEDKFGAAGDHFLHEKSRGSFARCALNVGHHRCEARADVFARDIDRDAAYIALVRDLGREDLQHHGCAQAAGGRGCLFSVRDDGFTHGGDAEAREQLLCGGFVERAGMVVAGGLPSAEMSMLTSAVPLSKAEQDLLISWQDPPAWDSSTGREAEPPGRGKFLVKVGGHPGTPLKVQLMKMELEVNDTNRMWHAGDNLPPVVTERPDLTIVEADGAA